MRDTALNPARYRSELARDSLNQTDRRVTIHQLLWKVRGQGRSYMVIGGQGFETQTRHSTSLQL